MRFNISNLTYGWPANSSNPLYLWTYADSAVDGLMGGMFLLVAFLILTGVLSRYNTRLAATASSFVCFIIAVLLRTQSLTSDYVVLIFLALTIGLGALNHFSK